MALQRPQWETLPKRPHRLAMLSGLLIAIGAALPTLSPAQACELAPVTGANSYRSPVDLSELSPAQQATLEATVTQRQAQLPYRFLSLHRCPSLSNAALQAFENRDYALSLQLLDRAISDNPDALSRWLDRAMVHYYLGEDAAARADAQAVRRRFTYPRSQTVQEAYRQLMIQLDGQVPDPRRAIPVPKR